MADLIRFGGVLVLLLCACAAQGQTTAPASTQPGTVVAPAAVWAFYSTDLYAKESGYVADIKADIGDHVKKGDILATIDAPELQQQLASVEAVLAAKQGMHKASEAAVQQAKAALAVTNRQLQGYEADLALAQTTLKRQEALFAGKAATSQQIDDMRAKEQIAQATVNVAQAKIASANADVAAAEANQAVAAAQVKVAAADVERTKTLLGYTKIVAPFDGIITRRLLNPGDLVQAATASRTTPLFTCQKIDVVRVACEVTEASAGSIKVGTKAEVRLFGKPGQTIQGTVTRIANAMDPTTRTMRAEIDLPNPGELMRPGMYAQVTLTPEISPAK